MDGDDSHAWTPRADTFSPCSESQQKFTLEKNYFDDEFYDSAIPEIEEDPSSFPPSHPPSPSLPSSPSSLPPSSPSSSPPPSSPHIITTVSLIINYCSNIEISKFDMLLNGKLFKLQRKDNCHWYYDFENKKDVKFDENIH